MASTDGITCSSAYRASMAPFCASVHVSSNGIAASNTPPATHGHFDHRDKHGGGGQMRRWSSIRHSPCVPEKRRLRRGQLVPKKGLDSLMLACYFFGLGKGRATRDKGRVVAWITRGRNHAHARSALRRTRSHVQTLRDSVGSVAVNGVSVRWNHMGGMYSASPARSVSATAPSVFELGRSLRWDWRYLSVSICTMQTQMSGGSGWQWLW
jgi:hypothetical protein